jgi:predicted AlkP superfamily pyrophosphatase or phosphodiesterase
VCAAGVGVLSACSAGAQPRTAAAARPAARPTLVVVLTIDQFGTDYLDRYGVGFTHGLRRLVDEGALWARGLHDHAIAETAPGHASILSGRFPVSTGISSNSQGVNTPDAPLLGSDDPGASPFRFHGTTLHDWLRTADPRTRALSVSRKDRGAILPIGTARTDVYWYASNGLFTTSTYYRDQLPAWVRAFNERRLPQRYAGRAWTLLHPEDRYAEPDSIPLESGGHGVTFPHVLSTDPGAAASDIRDYPWMDSLTLAFALDGVRELRLGAADDRTDLLAISLSATDAVGHRYGPDSREIHDHLLRLDRYVGEFLDRLFAMRDADRVLIALTADHGVAPYPGLRSPYYANHGAQRVDRGPAWAFVYERMRAAGIDTSAAFHDDGFRVRDPEAFRRMGADPDDFAALWVREMRRMTGVLRADRIVDLARADTVHDDIARRWLHMFDAAGPVRAVSTHTPFSYWTGVNYATHGQPHDYDTRVPILFWGAGIVPGRRGSDARVVDIAPTLAELIGVTPTERLDGRALPVRR